MYWNSINKIYTLYVLRYVCWEELVKTQGRRTQLCDGILSTFQPSDLGQDITRKGSEILCWNCPPMCTSTCRHITAHMGCHTWRDLWSCRPSLHYLYTGSIGGSEGLGTRLMLIHATTTILCYTICIAPSVSGIAKAGPGRAHAWPKHHVHPALVTQSRTKRGANGLAANGLAANGLAYSRCPASTNDLATPLPSVQW